jgi:hypothetical protein
MKSIHKILFIWENYYLSKKYNRIDIINDMKEILIGLIKEKQELIDILISIR